MKKLFTVFVAVGTAIALLAGCTSSDMAGGDASGQAAPDMQAELTARAGAYVEAFHKGEFSGFLTDATTELSGALTVESLAEMWKQQTEPLGEFEAVADVIYSEKDGYRNVGVVDNYADKSLQTVITFDGDGKVAGLHFYPGDKQPAEGASSDDNAGNVTGSEDSVDEETLKARSTAYLEQFRAGSFDDFYNDCDPSFVQQAPKETLAASWAAAIPSLGAFQGIQSEVYAEQEGKKIVTVTEGYLLRMLAATFVYDESGKVVSMGSAFQPLLVEPQSGDGWQEEAVQIGSDKYANKLSGLLTLPLGTDSKKAPVVILLQGSGAHNMDEIYGTAGNKPFAEIAHGLAAQGIATIRYDKRTYAYPAEAVNNPTIAVEYLDDAAAAIAFAAADARLDSSRIYILGHSEGGMVAPQIAKDNPQVAGLISMAGSLRHLEDFSLEQTKMVLAQDTTLTDEQKQQALKQTEDWVNQVKNLDPSDTTTVIAGIPAGYWNSLNAIDGPAIVKQLKIPMLILQGEADFQVPAAVDYKLWQDTLSGRADASFRLYPGLSHMFTKVGSADELDISVYDAAANVEPQMIADVAEWVNGLK